MTMIELGSIEDAEQCLRWYCLGWRIEDIAHETAERVRRAIGVNLVIAWRIMLMTLLGRETQSLPADVLFSGVELQTQKTKA